jgi:hypothetical protein
MFWGTMVSRWLVASWFALSFFGLPLLGQQNVAAPAVREFPVTLQQRVVAGKNLVGSKVRAKLEIATLVDGAVFPRNSVLTGEVTESWPKTAADPSRLAIRMDSIQWKKGSAAIKVYLTAWYYPTTAEAGQNLKYGPPQSPTRTWNGQGAYPSPNSGSYKPFPGGDSDSDKNSIPETPSTKLSDHPVLMKDAEATRSEDGTLKLISKRSNITLDRLTTYVFAESDLATRK